MNEAFARLNEKEINVINNAQAELKNQTGNNIVLVAYCVDNNKGGNINDKAKL
ncbi:MAG: hypothetical protein RSD67_01810 [Oscillospiraceae bacterium]